MLRSVRPLDSLGRQELVDQSLHRFEGRDRTGVLADEFGFGPGKRFGERVAFVGSEAGLGDDRLWRRRAFDGDDGRGLRGCRRIAGCDRLLASPQRPPEGEATEDEATGSARGSGDSQPGRNCDRGLGKPRDFVEAVSERAIGSGCDWR